MKAVLKAMSFVLLTCFFWLQSDGAFADFGLPILFPVDKRVLVDERTGHDFLKKLSKIHRLSLEVEMSEGNMMRDVLLNALKGTLKGIPKRIILSGKVNMVHAEQLKLLDKFEIYWRSKGRGMDKETFESLYELGPVRKFIEIPQSAEVEDLAYLRRMKFYTPVVLLGNKPLDAKKLAWLEESKHKRPCFVLGPGFPPEGLYDLCRFSPLCLEVRTQANVVPAKLMSVLKDLRGVEVTFVADGRLTLENVRSLARLERFSLKIELGYPLVYTPGLVKLLNTIAPASMLRSGR